MKYEYINFKITEEYNVSPTRSWKSFEPAYAEFLEGESIVLFRREVTEDAYLQLIMPKKIFADLHQLGGLYVTPYSVEYDKEVVRKYVNHEIQVDASTSSLPNTTPKEMSSKNERSQVENFNKWGSAHDFFYMDPEFRNSTFERIESAYKEKIIDIEYHLDYIHVWTEKGSDVIIYRSHGDEYRYQRRYHPEFENDKNWYEWNDKPLPENYKGLVIRPEERHKLEEED